jgi:hypothetical protein
MPKRARAVVQTINQFFFVLPPPAPAPAADNQPPAPVEPKWLPPPPPAGGRFSQNLGGALRIQCNQRKSCRFHTPDQFCPTKNPRDAATYTGAVEALTAARCAKDGEAFLTARTTITNLATAWCAPCRAIHAKTDKSESSKTGECRAKLEELKTSERFSRCACCGSTRNIEFNHRKSFHDNMKLYDAMVKTDGKEAAEARYPPGERKLSGVAEAAHWSCNGGTEALQAEAEKCDPLCGMCHALDESSNQAPQNASSRAKAAAKTYKTKKARKDAILVAGYKEDKRAYNNALKRRIGQCENPDCPKDGPCEGRCTAGFEVCYELDHLVEATKKYTISDLVCSNQSPATAIPLILAEIGLPANFNVETDPIPPMAARRIRLLCKNCHNTRKDWDTVDYAAVAAATNNNNAEASSSTD